MIRRILVIGSIGLALAGGARFALREIAERAWERRKGELRALAVFPEEARRPWEVRFQAMAERVRTSPRFDEITGSSHRPYVALGSGEPRRLDEFERVWLESLWGELTGLDSVLAALRELPLDELEWHGEPARLAFVREVTNGLCGRAWLALERGDGTGAARAYADALRLARATDDGTIVGTMVRVASEDVLLGALRAALAFGASPGELSSALAPLLAGLGHDPARVERAIRLELGGIEDLATLGERWEDPAQLLSYFAPVEEELARASQPASRLGLLDGSARTQTVEGGAAGSSWRQMNECLWAQHARRNVALTALAVASFKERKGRFPASLAELGDLPPEQALDPLEGAPLAYSLVGSTATVGPAAWPGVSDADESASDEMLLAWTLR